MGEWLAQYWALITGIAAIIGSVFYNSKKVEVDKDASIFKAWKELLDSHQTQLAAMTNEIRVLKDRLDKAEGRIRELEDEIRKRDDTIIGLKRAIAQNSQSTAVQIGRVKSRAKTAEAKADDAEGRIDSLTTDKNTAHDEINEHLDRLDRAGDNSIPKEGK